jgi:hypothetical protein
MDRDALAAMPEAGPMLGSEVVAAKRGGSSFRALKSRPFRIYFGGQVVSASGSFLQQTALGWLVFKLTGSASDLGLVLAAGGIPSLLFGPWGGAVADSEKRADPPRPDAKACGKGCGMRRVASNCGFLFS